MKNGQLSLIGHEVDEVGSTGEPWAASARLLLDLDVGGAFALAQLAESLLQGIVTALSEKE
jgi:hypothetical protein